MTERQDNEVEEADQIYLLMKEEYRISRNVRLAWFLGKLNQVIWPASKSKLLNSENELDLLSILPKGWQTDFSPTMHPYMLMPSTRATFLARRYRFIIELDLSPSTGIVDDSTGEMIFDEVFHALSRCLAGLAQPFKVPGTDQLFKPKIFITILAYSSIIGLTSHQVLVQGCQLERTDLVEFLHYIYQQLRAVESSIAEVLHQQHEQSVEPVQSSGLHSNILDDQPHGKQGISMLSADMGLVSMVRQGILALQLLPPNSSAGIIIITDGVTSVPDVAVCETLLNQLRSGTIACSFVQVGGAYSYDCSFGYIPNVELMKFISLATFGSYLPSCPDVDLNSQEMNTYHKAFLTYSFLNTPESMNSEYFCVPQHKLFNEHLVSASGNPALVMRRKKHTEKEVHAHLISVVSVRLREGYTIREISLSKGGTQLEVKLVLLWKHNMHIEYLAAASWPLDPAKRTTRVEVTMEGSYDILHDISCTQRKPITSPYRTSVIRRFWNTLQSINQTDQMLVHLQSFNSIPENYMIPESTKNGVPLFYIPPGSTTPVLSLQHSGSKDSSQSQFASYWKPILSMDANFWQRWLHMHRIAIILEHDMPVPKHLHTAGNNGRYSTIQCRISHSALTSLLRDWSSFVLVEGYSYVKLIYSSSEQPPTSFYLVRLISKTPCMVLRLGFPIGTPARVRNKIVDELREQILKLRFPHRVQNKEATPKTKRKIVGHPSPAKSPSIPAPKPSLSDRPCVVVLNKPLEKLLIRYEKLPLDFRTPFIFNMENFPQPSNSSVPLSMAANRTASSTLASLSRYFLHQRWVWAVQSSQGVAVAMQAVAHILTMLSECFTEDKEVSAEELEKKEEEQELPEYLHLHQMVVRKIGEICRIVNQRMLLQDLHDCHVCNSLLVAESEEDIWKNESLYRQRLNTSDDYNTEESYQARDYLAATMQFIPGHFSCDVVWSTIIHIHPRLKMGPNMGVSRAIQALRSVLNSFCVVNRKNMFVYQERTTKSVFYLRLCETSLTGKYSDVDGNIHMTRSIGLARSQEPLYSEEFMGSKSSLDGSRPVGQVDKHILLLVHGVGNTGPEITDELVKVLRKRLDETTLDIITVMLVRNCKLTPADVEFIQPSGSPATEVMNFSLPNYCLPWLPAVAHYLRQNLLIFLHVPKYTDSNTAHHFKHYFHLSGDLADGDIYLYNKPGGQGTGGKGIACITLSFVDAHSRPLQVPVSDCAALQRSENCTIPIHPHQFDELTAVGKVDSNNMSSATEPQLYVRFDIWEQGNISPLQLSDKLQGALRHALCDVVMELRVLPNTLCLGGICPATKVQREEAKGLLIPSPEVKEVKDSPRQRSGSRVFKSSPSPITLTQAGGSSPMPGTSTPESTTPTSKSTRRSFWDILSKPDSSELGSPKTTDDIVQEKGEEGRAARRRHKTESVKQQWSQEKALAVELEQAQRRQVSQLEEGDAGTLHPVYQVTCQPWITFMAELGCPSIQQCTAEIASHFLLPSILAEIVSLVSSLASDTIVKAFEKTSCPTSGDIFVPFPLVQTLSQSPDATRSFILIGRNFHQWHCSTEQEDSSDEENTPVLNRFTPHKGFQRFEALEQSDWFSPSQAGAGLAPRQRFLFIIILDKKVTLYSYNWSVDLGSSLNRELVRLVKWQNARSHVVHCLLNQKMGLFHHYCFSDAPIHEMDSKQDPNPFLSPSMEPDALLRSAVPPLPNKEQGRLSSSVRSLAPLHFPSELLPFDEALRDVCTIRPLMEGDVVARHGSQLLEIKAAERRELEKQMKIENLFVTWQQRSAQSNMPISGADLETLKQSSRLVHYCATPLLFDPIFRKQIQEEQIIQPPVKKRHRSSDSTASGRDRSYSTDSADMLPSRLKEEPWLLDISSTFIQQYVQYLQSMGFILVQVRPQSPARSIARGRAAMLNSMSSEGRMSFSYVKQKSEDSPKTTASGTTAYHLQRALPGGIVLMELAFQGCYFCVKQYALECSRIPMGQTVNSQGSLLTKPRCKQFPDATPVSDCALSMLFTEECDKVRDLMHVHSFSYDFHLRVVHQYLVGCHMTLRQGYQLTDFLDDFISHHPDIPKFGRNHVFQGSFSISTGMITAHQLYNYITDHASTYGMKPLRMSKAAVTNDNKKGTPDLHEYALVALWNSSGSYKDLEGLHHHDDFDVSLVVCHNAAPFEEQSDGERHLLRLRFYVIMTSQRELFPRLTADMRRFKKLPQIPRDPAELGGRLPTDRAEACGSRSAEQDLWEETPSEAAVATAPSDGNEFYPLAGGGAEAQRLLYPSPLFPLLNNEVVSARRQIQASVEQAMGHCRRDNLWRRLFHGEHLALDKLKLTKLSFSELEELLEAVQSRSVGEIDPQLDCFLTMSPAWYQSLIKVLLNRFPQSCRHFDDNGIQYLAVLNQKFTDCFVLVFLDTQAGKTSLKVVFREPLPSQQQASSSPPPQLVSMYHHLESVINTACYNLWTGLL
ncbi:KICSTOR complex protein SZT2 [Cottoperca gobio]|uniref:KICSTOR complex protein SZT2 n=1 Tax=Cottoperca gobio TaxID=56716 RepID=A0A6J2PIG8_COTGO|nr:KICSTOR complex protein SZT2 [Cottoperca gobio]